MRRDYLLNNQVGNVSLLYIQNNRNTLTDPAVNDIIRFWVIAGVVEVPLGSYCIDILLYLFAKQNGNQLQQADVAVRDTHHTYQTYGVLVASR